MKINGRRTSVRLERGFWDALDDMARRRGLDIAILVSEVDQVRGDRPLVRALRVASVSYFREFLNRATDVGAARAVQSEEWADLLEETTQTVFVGG
ncbi:ribbon-helix-helix domain-containing protein [Azospirillum sp. A29]|uniref:ribbon-helix-helix domain-containing protein n=1 Tax=Azospirillum sp. A29 TaxID=3160606 RepID=UPI00366FD781